jgi:hypothetical protein
MKKFLLIILIFITKVFANDVQIIYLPLAKSVSLACETALVDNKVFNVLTNPAMLSFIDFGYSLEYNKLFYYGDTGYDVFGLSVNQPEGNVGFVVGNFSSDKIEVHDILGQPTGETAEYSNKIFAFGFSTNLSSGKDYFASLGFSGYYISEKINVDTQYFGCNIGLVYEQRFQNSIFKNFRIGSVIKGLGMNKNLLHNEAISAQVGPINFIFGYENFYPETSKDKFKIATTGKIYSSKDNNYEVILNLGYNLGEFTNSFSSGFEIKLKRIYLGYSFAQHQYLGSLQNIYLSLKL